MHEPLYILTNVLPKNGEFEAYLRDIRSNEVRKIVRRFESKENCKNISMILQFFIENEIFPLSVYDSRLNLIGRMSHDTFKNAISERYVAIDIEVLNPNRIPRPDRDEIVCISYGNKDRVVVGFNGESDIKFMENYIVFFDDEKKLLKETFEDLENSSGLFLAGHNIFGFDLRYMKKRAEIFKIPNEIKSYTAKTLFSNENILILPNLINIDLLPILQYANLPSVKLEHVAKIFGLESKKMPIEELWIYYNSKEYDRIIEHNVNDIITTSEILNKISFPIYLLAEKTIGTFTYGLYSNLPKNIMVRTLLDYCKDKRYRIDKILEIIDKELEKISFSLNREEVKGKLEAKVDARLEKAKLLDLPLMVSERLKDYLIFENLLKTYQEIGLDSTEEKLCKRIISGILYKILTSMRKKEEYKKEIESKIEEIKNEVGKNSKVYCSSGKYLVVNDFQDYSSSLTNVILCQEPKVFLANCEGILIGTIPRKPVGMPERFYEAFIQDLFNIALGKPTEEMKKIGERLERGNFSPDDLKIQLSGVDTTQLTRDSKKKIFVDKTVKRKTEPWERIYVVRLKGEKYLALEEMRRNREKIKEVDLDFYRKEFSKLQEVYKKISSRNSLNAFFG
jgi:hypothetical protein